MDPTNNSILTIRLISNCLSISNFVTFFLLISSFNLPQRSSGDVSSEKETTLAIIKPDGLFGNYTSSIKKIILDSGFSIPREMMVQLDDESVKIFYAEHSSKSFFPSLVTYMTSGPVLIMVLEKVNAISDWRVLIGPTDACKAKITHPRSIRAMCGIDLTRNCVHGSDSHKSAAREISFFFKETSADFPFSCKTHYSMCHIWLTQKRAHSFRFRTTTPTLNISEIRCLFVSFRPFSSETDQGMHYGHFSKELFYGCQQTLGFEVHLARDSPRIHFWHTQFIGSEEPPQPSIFARFHVHFMSRLPNSNEEGFSTGVLVLVDLLLTMMNCNLVNPQKHITHHINLIFPRELFKMDYCIGAPYKEIGGPGTLYLNVVR